MMRAIYVAILVVLVAWLAVVHVSNAREALKCEQRGGLYVRVHGIALTGWACVKAQLVPDER